MTATPHSYHDRMRRVLDHIDRHLDEDLDLDRLSDVAAFSRYHFHRQFAAAVGMSVHRYVQLARMKRASYRLAYRPDARITDIAFDSGYAASDAFARAFRQRFGQSPSAFRAGADWHPWQAALGPFDDARNTLMPHPYHATDVAIRDVPATPVAIMTHRGDPALLGNTLQRFIAWRRANGLPPAMHATFNIFHDDPRTTSAEAYRLDLCVAIDRPIGPDEPVVAGIIPGGRCAVLRVTGDTDDLEPAARFLYGAWLPASGETPRDFPLYCQRLRLYPDVPAQEAMAELFLPLR